ncbi:flavodoxin family protein [Papillibacter cinnamivorans]|uniref:Flavodoxin n=1 Tax=Papillibacter cinnamivorans DSM 12816 TaxID=1122930 RepID=A0A1W2AYR4_9FIRM|nr:flavodoxin family protein [Papillibacter cinnamivorans]SMC65328.1 Flavodoxin [Papillibacter cinnamivorans DSM 12816]
MKAIVVVSSYHHKNTEKVAERIAEILDAGVTPPELMEPGSLVAYDLVGFGSGIYDGKHHKRLLALADKLPRANGTKAFLFSTDGMPRAVVKDEVMLQNKMFKDHAVLREKLRVEGYEIVGEFGCAGFNTNSFLKLFGGINKGRPDDRDLAQAAEFALRLKNIMTTK